MITMLFFFGKNLSAAVVTFTGYVRDYCDDGDVQALDIEALPGYGRTRFGKKSGCRLKCRFGLLTWRIVHRYGTLNIADPIVWVGVGADHRGVAFDACQFHYGLLED